MEPGWPVLFSCLSHLGLGSFVFYKPAFSRGGALLRGLIPFPPGTSYSAPPRLGHPALGSCSSYSFSIPSGFSLRGFGPEECCHGLRLTGGGLGVSEAFSRTQLHCVSEEPMVPNTYLLAIQLSLLCILMLLHCHFLYPIPQQLVMG